MRIASPFKPSRDGDALVLRTTRFAALLLGCRQRFAADLGCAVETSLLEVIGGVAAHFVQDVRQDVRAEGRKSLAGDRMFLQAFDEPLVGVLKLYRILGRPHRHAGGIEDDDLDVLGAHDRTQASASCVARGPKLHVGERNGSGAQFHFSGRSDRDAAHLVAELLLHLLDQIVIREHLEAVVLRDLDPVLVNEDLVEVVARRLPFEHDGAVAELCKDLGSLAPGVCLLDAPGKRALAAHGDPA